MGLHCKLSVAQHCVLCGLGRVSGVMSNSHERSGQQHGPPGRGAGTAAGRDHRDMGQGVRGRLAEKEDEIQKLNRQLGRTVEEVKKWKEHSKNQSKKIQELQSLPQVTPEQVRYTQYVSTCSCTSYSLT